MIVLVLEMRLRIERVEGWSHALLRKNGTNPNI
jgi:hypothetical protein